jgi:hypothetical protein
MKLDDRTEATMTRSTTLDSTDRYGYAPQVFFAATRACAERRAQQAAAATAAGSRRSGLVHRLRSLVA